MPEVFGMPVVILPKEHYRFRPRTGECFHFEFALLTGTRDFHSGRYIPDPHLPEKVQVWSKYDQR